MTNQGHAGMQCVQNRYQQKMWVDPADFIGRKVLKSGIYDLETLVLLESLFKAMSPGVILDVGANIGNHTLMFSRYAQRVLAFEPGHRAFGVLQQNLAANGLDHVTALNVGLSDTDATQTLYVELSGNLGESSLTLQNLTSDQYLEDTIALRVGDAVVAEQGVGQVDFIKIDVEGHEQAVIQGLRQTIRSSRPVVLMEWELEKSWLLDELKHPQVLESYAAFPLIWNTSPAYWSGKPFGGLRRVWRRVFGRKQRVPCPLEVCSGFDRVSDVLLVPVEKLGLVEPLVYR